MGRITEELSGSEGDEILELFSNLSYLLM